MQMFLIGYMGSGKSTVGKLLAATLGFPFIDFDTYIEEKEGLTITAIFERRGEIYFRKQEALHLARLLEEIKDKDVIVSLGGGTPCYGNNMQHITSSGAHSIYLNIPYKTLAHRLWEERASRPLIARQTSLENLEDFVRKHLFERSFYYNQSAHVIKVDADTQPKDLVEKIVLLLF